MSKHEQAWANMLNPLILTGVTSKPFIYGLGMLILHHETLYGDKKEQLSTHEQAWACLLYTSDAADDTPCVDLVGRRII